MPASEQIAIAPHLAFDAITAGKPGAPLVLLLHGFAESMHCWRAQVAALGDMGYRAIAPSQRGYSPGARPDPREFSHYLIDRLMDDAMAIVAAAGYGECALSSRRPRLGRQHRLGHRRPPPRAARLAHHSLAAASERVQSRADEPTANRRSARGTTRRFWNRMPPMSCWPTTPNGCASVGPPTACPPTRSSGIWPCSATRQAMEAALAWYRARGAIRGPLGPIRVPTLYIWGDADDTVGRAAAEGTVDFIAAPYRFEVLPGVGHFAADQAPERVCELMLEHLAAHPV